MAIDHGIETATFHILTPYPGTALYKRMSEQGRLTVDDWDLYDTRHTVFRPARMTAEELETGISGRIASSTSGTPLRAAHQRTRISSRDSANPREARRCDAAGAGDDPE